MTCSSPDRFVRTLACVHMQSLSLATRTPGPWIPTKLMRGSAWSWSCTSPAAGVLCSASSAALWISPGCRCARACARGFRTRVKPHMCKQLRRLIPITEDVCKGVWSGMSEQSVGSKQTMSHNSWLRSSLPDRDVTFNVLPCTGGSHLCSMLRHQASDAECAPRPTACRRVRLDDCQARYFLEPA
eukprot:1158958-Pelagomonas_calceolata.AAC.9